MSFFLSPTTLVVCCTIAKTANESEIAELCGIANRYSLPVTWVISPENLSRATAVISGLSHQHQIALAGFPDWFEGNHSRGLLRRALSSALSIHPLLESIVVPPCTHLSHRDILVENGISTACVDSFEPQLRRSRRPVPEGWPCRSLFWGLWDVQFSSRQTIGSFGSWFGRSVPHQSGALIVQHTTRVVGERQKLMGIPAEALNIAQAPERESQRRACMRGKIFEPFHTIGMRSKKSKAQRV